MNLLPSGIQEDGDVRVKSSSNRREPCSAKCGLNLCVQLSRSKIRSCKLVDLSHNWPAFKASTTGIRWSSGNDLIPAGGTYPCCVVKIGLSSRSALQILDFNLTQLAVGRGGVAWQRATIEVNPRFAYDSAVLRCSYPLSVTVVLKDALPPLRARSSSPTSSR